MNTNQILGLALITLVLVVYALWVWHTKNKKGTTAKSENGEQVFAVLVKGVYAPDTLRAKVGRPVRIDFRREEDNDCSRFVNFSDFKIRQELPQNKTVSVKFTPHKKGEYLFTCDMSMYRGRLIVE